MAITGRVSSRQESFMVDTDSTNSCDDSGIVIPEYTKESVRIASIEWLYDVRKGWYMVRRLVDGRYQDLHVLNRQQALDWRNPNPKEYVLELKHFYEKP